MPQASVATIVKVRLGVQFVVPSTCVTLMVGVPQLSMAVTRAMTLASVGRVAALQPRLTPVGTLVIVGGVLKALPLTGVTLPFLSYGGSSMLVSFVALGLLLCISRDSVGWPSNG